MIPGLFMCKISGDDNRLGSYFSQSQETSRKQWQQNVSVLTLSSVWRCEVKIASSFWEGGAEEPSWRDGEEKRAREAWAALWKFYLHTNLTTVKERGGGYFSVFFFFLSLKQLLVLLFFFFFLKRPLCFNLPLFWHFSFFCQCCL